ncbi:MAG: beta strand repeat-containing protein, partial [Micrococcales bacterium]
FTTQPVVTVQDVSGNTVTGSTAAVSVAIDSGTLTGTTTVNAVSGVATFAGVGKTGLIGSKTLTFSASGLTSATQTFMLTHGAATQVALTAPSTNANDTVLATQPVATIKDADGNVVTSGAQSTQTVTLTSTDATIAGTTSMAAVAGVADFAGKGVKLTGVIGARNLTATITNPSTITGVASVIITHGSASKLAVTTQAAGFVNRVAFTTQPVVTVQDVSGNTVTDATDAVTVALTGATLTGTATVNAVNGLATFAGLSKYGTVGTKTLSFSATGLTSAMQSFTLTHGAAYQLANSVSSTLVNDTAFATQPVITIQDQDGNTVTTGTQSTQTVTLTSTDATIGGTTSMAAVAGVADFAGKGVKLTGLVGARNLTSSISNPSAIAASSTVSLTFGAATKLTLVTPATGFVNRQAFSTQPVIHVQDVSGNLVGNASTSIVVSSSAGNGATLGGTTTMSAVNGVADFGQNASALKLSGAVGSYTLTFAKVGGGLTTASQTVALTHAAADHLVVVTSAAGFNSGSAFATQPVVNIVDVDGNLVDTGADATANVTASLTGSGTATLGGTTSVAAVAGVATFTNLSATGSAGNYSLGFSMTAQASATAMTTNQSIALAAGAAVAIVVTQQPSTVQTRATMTPAPTVSLRDAQNNVVTADSSSTVTAQLLDSTGATVGVEGAPVTAASGVVTFSNLAYQALPADGYRLRFKLVSNGATATSSAFTINPGNATELRITTQPASFDLSLNQTKTGELLAVQPIVALYDQDGNLVTTTNTGSATVSIATGAGGSLAEGSTTANFVGGVATFSGVKLTATPTVAYKLKFVSGALTSVNSNDLVVTHNVADHLAVQQGFAGGRAGVGFTTPAKVRILDRYGNLVNTGSQSSTVIRTAVSTGGSLMGGTQVPAVAGEATFSSLILGGSTASSYAITFSTTNSAITVAQQTGISLTFGYGDHIALSTQPATVVGQNQSASGSDLLTQPVVRVLDAYGNLVTDATDTITASIVSTQGLTLADGSAARLVNATVNAVGGVATFQHLKLIGLPGVDYTLGFEDYGLNPISAAAPVQVMHAAAHHLTVTTAPVGGNATGSDLATQPVVELRDQYENLVTSDSSLQVSAAISSSTGLTLADGTAARVSGATAAVTNGVATFAALKLFGLPNTDYQLTFSGTAVASAATATNIRVTFAAADHVSITRQPVANVTGSALSTQPIVEIRDRFENLVADSTATVSASVIGTGAALTVAGNISPSALDATAVGGVVNFSNLVLTATPATSFQLRFSSVGLTAATSA